LLASIRSEGQFNSIIYEETDSYRYNADRWSVLVSPEDLQRLGLLAGQRVDIHSADGEMRGLKVHPFDLPPGNLMAYYPEANVLTDRSRDPRSQTPRFKSIPVALTRSADPQSARLSGDA
jgi:anaerobic selenocysteine-containing dehydrogenase